MKKTFFKPHSKIFDKNLMTDMIITILIFLVMLIIISSPKQFTDGTISGLKLFFYNVLPGLFPFMLLTKLLTEIGFLFKLTSKLDRFSYKIFGTPGVSIYAFLMSILSGYPIGAKIISDLYSKNLITENEAKKMTVFCTTSGPIFVIGTVGTIMFNSFKIGLILYFSHILSSVILGVGYNIITKRVSFENSRNKIQFIKSDAIISNSVSQTINSLFIVGAYITIFFLLTEILDNLKIINSICLAFSPVLKFLKIPIEYFKGFLYGLLEVTRGAKELSTISSSVLAVSTTSAILSFSGLSIIMQSMAFLKQAKIKTLSFVFAKCLHMILSFAICFLILLVV